MFRESKVNLFQRNFIWAQFKKKSFFSENYPYIEPHTIQSCAFFLMTTIWSEIIAQIAVIISTTLIYYFLHLKSAWGNIV